MISTEELRGIANARLEDAKVLLEANRHDGAIYLCGYVVEIALKARICDTLGWGGFPESNKEFQPYRSFKTHDLDVLLSLSGMEAEIKSSYLADWSAVATWAPGVRYNPVGTADREDAELMIDAADSLLGVL